MIVAVLSGKGGTGKTFVAANLAATIKNSVYVDCDVEEPNGRLFLKCEATQTKDVCIMLPSFDAEKCTGCRACVRFCKFNALAFIGKSPKVFKEICHSCGGCRLVCASRAVTETPVPVGKVETGLSCGVTVVTGEMNIGEASGVPVIREALGAALALNSPFTVIDCPPGSACTVTESISRADFCLMVAEPTVFGLHNLKMVAKLAELMGKPRGVVINKSDGGFPPLESFCRENNIPILAEIPYKKEFASCISAGRLAVSELCEARLTFEALARKIGGEL